MYTCMDTKYAVGYLHYTCIDYYQMGGKSNSWQINHMDPL